MLNDKTLKSALQTGALLPVYMVCGDDIYLKKQALSRITQAVVSPDDDMNLVRYNFGVSMQELYDELNGFPVMSDKKCVVLSDFDIEKAPKSDLEQLIEIIGDPCDTSVFVLYFGNTDIDLKKSKKVKSVVAAVTKAGGDVVCLEHKSAEELVRWLCSSAKKQGLVLSPKNAQYITEICSTDINFLTNELTKLCVYTKEGEITKQIIDKVCVKSVDASIFDLSSKVILGDTAGAMKLLDELYYMNIDSMPIFYNIASAYVDMYRVSEAKREGRNNIDELAEQFGIPSNRVFLLRKAANNLRKFDSNKLSLSFDAIIKTEKELKSYSITDRVAVEKLVVRLIYIMKTGESLD
ncbi:MAG: DNA polymerase III subunit delta [Clostridia bacterium]|nr:DNA polymerase III subunit delta [Clostridia bacterium]